MEKLSFEHTTMGYALLISHNFTQFCLYVELKQRMDRVGATWSVDQVASTCKLSGPTIAAKIITLICF